MAVISMADEVQGIEYSDSTTSIDQTPHGRREHNILMKKKKPSQSLTELKHKKTLISLEQRSSKND